MTRKDSSHTQSPAGRDARRAAFELTRAVLRGGQTLEEALAEATILNRLDSRDRGFARHLATTVLRRLGQIDAAVAGCLDRPLKGKLSAVQDLLRLGAAQVLFMEVSDHAAVGETVEMASGVRVGPHKGLINAVLRRLTRERAAILESQDAERLNTPAWLWKRWVAHYGEATARAIAAQHMQEPPLDITVKPGEDLDAWAERLGARVLPTGSLRLGAGSGDIRRLPGFQEGAWWIQDAAAALPAKLLLQAAGEGIAGDTVLDLCAAPGGKTAQLAAAGAKVVALDRSAERMAQLNENLSRLSLAAANVVANATRWSPPQSPAWILLDAPCTSTGTLRRHPDIALLKRPGDIESMAVVQRDILAAAAEMLEPGGTLVYATCSLEPEEGPDQVAALLRARGDFARVPVQAGEAGGLAEAITPEGDLRTLPCHLAELGGMDGFYAARLRKT